MSEELTTAMHSEFIGDEIQRKDLDVLGVFGAIRRGETLTAALDNYDMTEEYYRENIERCLRS